MSMKEEVRCEDCFRRYIPGDLILPQDWGQRQVRNDCVGKCPECGGPCYPLEVGHTPGPPWYLLSGNGDYNISTTTGPDWSRDNNFVGIFFGSEANARRIVAAVNACEGIPVEALENGVINDLREAVEAFMDLGWLEGQLDPRELHVWKKIRAAIAKAEGENNE